MRKLLLAGWLVAPIGAWAFHEGPGQDLMALDRTDKVLAAARAHASAGEWDACVTSYGEALEKLPAGWAAQSRRIRLELDKARMLAKQLPEAHADLRGLVDELAADPETAGNAEAKAVLAEARSAFANSQYYMTWLMRLEGLPREKWEPEVEASRQTYRLLAEEARAKGDAKAATKHEEDLESAVRLARMDLKDLQGLPLPSQ